ncbi:hypothetical protein NDU88_003139 [Pleurodeles waltl]|uniref:Uncharacterized protein n=1 Tax=Pleurodeles waltl TaxID=8319 RepID=A0AAV7L365_PLEWA|nr:hypothetical protein NDU88_003139 [Pleurodeles waltl]
MFRTCQLDISARFYILWQEKRLELEYCFKDLQPWHKQTGACSVWNHVFVAHKELKAPDYDKAKYTLLPAVKKLAAFLHANFRPSTQGTCNADLRSGLNGGHCTGI